MSSYNLVIICIQTEKGVHGETHPVSQEPWPRGGAHLFCSHSIGHTNLHESPRSTLQPCAQLQLSPRKEDRTDFALRLMIFATSPRNPCLPVNLCLFLIYRGRKTAAKVGRNHFIVPYSMLGRGAVSLMLGCRDTCTHIVVAFLSLLSLSQN